MSERADQFEWWIRHSDKKYSGPHHARKIQLLARDGGISPSTDIAFCEPGMRPEWKDWVRADRIEGLRFGQPNVQAKQDSSPAVSTPAVLEENKPSKVIRSTRNVGRELYAVGVLGLIASLLIFLAPVYWPFAVFGIALSFLIYGIGRMLTILAYIAQLLEDREGSNPPPAT